MAQTSEQLEQQMKVRDVTQVQAVPGPRSGSAWRFTVQLILDNGVDEYVLRPTQMMPRCCWSYCSAVTMRP